MQNSLPGTQSSGVQNRRNQRGETGTAISAVLVSLPIMAAFLLGGFALITLFTHRLVRTQTTPDFLADQPDTNPNRSISPVFTPEIQSWAPSILRWSAQYSLDSNWIATLMQIESCGDSHAQSSAGALGLFQVMPFHFSDDDNPLEPETNAGKGLPYFARALELGAGDLRLAMAGYNGGHGVIGWDPASWDPQTQRYVYWASGILADIARGDRHSDRLAEWLNAGGASLCAQASVALALE